MSGPPPSVRAGATQPVSATYIPALSLVQLIHVDADSCRVSFILSICFRSLPSLPVGVYIPPPPSLNTVASHVDGSLARLAPP